MPIQSKAQWREMARNQPGLFHEWQKEAPVDYGALPEHVQKTANFYTGFNEGLTAGIESEAQCKNKKKKSKLK